MDLGVFTCYNSVYISSLSVYPLLYLFVRAEMTLRRLTRGQIAMLNVSIVDNSTMVLPRAATV
jgi:hypothetical protein